jgi:hypothetical protein
VAVLRGDHDLGALVGGAALPHLVEGAAVDRHLLVEHRHLVAEQGCEQQGADGRNRLRYGREVHFASTSYYVAGRSKLNPIEVRRGRETNAGLGPPMRPGHKGEVSPLQGRSWARRSLWVPLSVATAMLRRLCEQACREILALEVADTESEATYHELFRSLKARGLRGVELVVSDDHQGLRAAVERHFQGASWQHCQVHYARNLLGMVGHARRKELAEGLRGVFAAPSRE